jgi:outer membrane receptor for ferrienterochelin and colicins
MYIRITAMSGLLLASSPVWSQQNTPAVPPVNVEAQKVQQVEINGAPTDIEANRELAAGKLIIGRQKITNIGLQNVNELLKREPAITIGKDGRLSLLGLPGYTQILVDGLPAIGKNPLDLDLSEVEQIEIIKTTTAETGPFGIAGTINVILRKHVRKNQQQLNLEVKSMGGEHGGSANWLMNQFSQDSPLSLMASVFLQKNQSPGNAQDTQILIAGSQLLPQFTASRHNLNENEAAALSGEIAYKTENGSLSFKPSTGQINSNKLNEEQRLWASGQSLQLTQTSSASLRSYRLPLNWQYESEELGNIDANLVWNDGQIRSNSSTLLNDQDNAASSGLRRQEWRDDNWNLLLAINHQKRLSGGHRLKTGLQVSRDQHETITSYLLNGAIDTSLLALGNKTSIRENKWRAFIQDDWRIDKNLAMNAGLSTEEQRFDLTENNLASQSRFRVWSPSLHVTKKLEGDQRRQLRASLARSFKAPESNQLMLQPSVNSLAPCTNINGCGANTIDTADSSGNPGLQPERALALNLAYEHGLSRDSQISLEFYARQIERKIGKEIVLAPVPWANVPRYVQRPANLGSASVQGINLDWRVAMRDLWSTSPKLDVRGSLGWAHSVLSDVPGPDNRLEGQLPWRAKLGMTFAMSDAPVKIDVDANWLPGDWLRNNLTLRTYESHRTTLTANAIWTVNPQCRLVLNLDNLLAPDTQTVREYFNTSSTVRTSTQKTNYARIGLRMEFKL